MNIYVIQIKHLEKGLSKCLLSLFNLLVMSNSQGVNQLCIKKPSDFIVLLTVIC